MPLTTRVQFKSSGNFQGHWCVWNSPKETPRGKRVEKHSLFTAHETERHLRPRKEGLLVPQKAWGHGQPGPQASARWSCSGLWCTGTLNWNISANGWKAENLSKFAATGLGFFPVALIHSSNLFVTIDRIRGLYSVVSGYTFTSWFLLPLSAQLCVELNCERLWKTGEEFTLWNWITLSFDDNN